LFVDEPMICHEIKTTIVIGSTQRAITFHFLSMNLLILLHDSNGGMSLSVD